MTTKPRARYVFDLMFGTDGASYARCETRAEYDRLHAEGWTDTTLGDINWDFERRYGRQFAKHYFAIADASEIISGLDALDE